MAFSHGFFSILIMLLIVSCNQTINISNGVKGMKTAAKSEADEGFLSPCFGTTPELSDFNHNQLYQYDPKELSQWMDPKSEQEKGVILLAHGLNLRPSKMNTLSHVFSRHGYHVLRLSLAGHRGSLNEMKIVTRNLWLSEMKAHYCLALKKAQSKNLPLYFVGYSLGAAVLLDLLYHRELKNEFRSLVTIAPAIQVHWYTRFPKLLAFFSKKIVIPSLNNKEYRMHKGTTTAAYEALHNIIDQFEGELPKKLSTPVLVIMDPEDELVSLDKIEKMKKRNGLHHWEIFKVSLDQPEVEKEYHHLIIDPPTAGQRTFNKIEQKMIPFLEL